MINENYFVICVIGLAVGTISIRGSFIALSGKMKISDKVRDLFTYIPAAILPGLIIPATFFHQGRIEILLGKERFIILMISALFAYFVRNTLAIICLGLTLLYLVGLSHSFNLL
jgi:branched-subunit amino acid transport protein